MTAQVAITSKASPPVVTIPTSTTTQTTSPIQTSRDDVNRDGKVSPLDALAIDNALYRQAQSVQSGTLHAHDAVFSRYESLDVNGDGVLSALDALLVINHLR